MKPAEVPTLSDEVDIALLPMPTARKVPTTLPEVLPSTWDEWDEAVSQADEP